MTVTAAALLVECLGLLSSTLRLLNGNVAVNAQSGIDERFLLTVSAVALPVMVRVRNALARTSVSEPGLDAHSTRCPQLRVYDAVVVNVSRFARNEDLKLTPVILSFAAVLASVPAIFGISGVMEGADGAQEAVEDIGPSRTGAAEDSHPHEAQVASPRARWRRIKAGIWAIRRERPVEQAMAPASRPAPRTTIARISVLLQRHSKTMVA
jgi:hypothetical protein